MGTFKQELSCFLKRSAHQSSTSKPIQFLMGCEQSRKVTHRGTRGTSKSFNLPLGAKRPKRKPFPHKMWMPENATANKGDLRAKLQKASDTNSPRITPRQCGD